MARSDRFDRYQRSHSWVGFPLAVAYKMFDDRAFYLAAVITYYAFVSLFPLLLVFVSVVGFVLQGDPTLRNRLINDAVSNFPDLGSELKRNLTQFKGSTPALAIGVIGTLYGGLGAMQAAQYAFNTIYAVPRNQQPNPIKSRLRSLGLLLLLGGGVLISTGVAVLVSTGNGISTGIGAGFRVLGFVVSVALNFGLFATAFRLLTTEKLNVKALVSGGLIAAGAWQLLQTFGSRYVQHEAAHGNAFYGVFGVVLAALAWIYLEALALVTAAEINMVLHRRLWPRSLLTPFTDRVELTVADTEAYTAYAKAQRFKGFQEVLARFRSRTRDTR